MGMLVGLRLMSRMFMGMETVLAGVVMIMNVGILGMFMLMGMLMDMLMGVSVGVFMSVGFTPMGVRMAVHMVMLMIVQVPVLVFSFHY
jgi:hypothetical protein